MAAPYSSADKALRSAYACEAHEVCKISTYLADLRGSSIGARSNLTPWDLLIEAAMIMAVMRETLPASVRDVVDLYYTVPNDMVLFNRREKLARIISYQLALRMPNVDRWYLCDVVREWAGGKEARKYNDLQWAKRLKVNPSTLYRWKAGQGHKNKGVLRELDRLLKQGRGLAEAVMIERGIVVID